MANGLLNALNTRAHAGKTFKMLTDMNEALNQHLLRRFVDKVV